MTEKYEDLARLISDSAKRGKLKKAILSKPEDKELIKATVTPILIGEKLCLQTECFKKDNKAVHKNTSAEDTEYLEALLISFGQINVITSAGECQLSRSKKGKILENGIAKLQKSLDGGEKLEYSGNNRRKDYILSGNEKFLQRLGVSDANGRIYDKKQSKFRQINRFLEYVRDCTPHLKSEGELRVLDLCCGKSYLSFALYHYLTEILGRNVRMTGIDLKEDVIRECQAVADDLEYSGLEFIAGDIRECKEEACDLVVSLHACDIATDIVLATAVHCRADVILSTPCCHHYLLHNMDCEELSFISKYSILSGKLADAATDALRLAYLEKEGYETAAFELIDPNETPKNVLMRGIRKKNFDKASKEAAGLSLRFEQIEAFLLGSKKYEYLN